jgi:hypothetical protein
MAELYPPIEPYEHGIAHRLAGIPGVMIHGRLDISGPVDAAWDLQQVWLPPTGSRLR